MNPIKEKLNILTKKIDSSITSSSQTQRIKEYLRQPSYYSFKAPPRLTPVKERVTYFKDIK